MNLLKKSKNHVVGVFGVTENLCQSASRDVMASSTMIGRQENIINNAGYNIEKSMRMMMMMMMTKRVN
jgi:hypothetical protein